MKEAKNIDRLTGFALDSFGIKDPLTKICPTCQKERNVSEFDSFECYRCSDLRAEYNADARAETQEKLETGEMDEQTEYLNGIFV